MAFQNGLFEELIKRKTIKNQKGGTKVSVFLNAAQWVKQNI